MHWNKAHCWMLRLWLRRVVPCVALLLVLAGLSVGVIRAEDPVFGRLGVVDLNPNDLFALVESGQGDHALALLIEEATERGGWGPAPGDEVVFDPHVARVVRGAVGIADALPWECGIDQISRHIRECSMQIPSATEGEVRFSHATFARPETDGSWSPWTNGDGILAVYIEEVGHSWQEYFYETEGRGSGPRTRATSWEAARSRSSGWEYQAKRYVLSLDGDLLDLSAADRAEMMNSICNRGGYANPLGQIVEPHGPPPGWPNPQGWPTIVPTRRELAAFCAAG